MSVGWWGVLKFVFVLIGLLLFGFGAGGASCEAYEVSSGFGMREHPIDGEARFHNGVDLAIESGTPFGSLWDGEVVFAGEWGGYGNCVVVKHGNEVHTLYGHLSRVEVGAGEAIGAGTVIGLVGSTGYSTGPHLHLSIWQGDQWIDPMSVLQ